MSNKALTIAATIILFDLKMNELVAKFLENEKPEDRELLRREIYTISQHLKSQASLDGITKYFQQNLEARRGEWMISDKELKVKLFEDGFTNEEFHALRKSGVFKFYETGWPGPGGGYQIYSVVQEVTLEDKSHG